jgi:hypothetical protein
VARARARAAVFGGSGTGVGDVSESWASLVVRATRVSAVYVGSCSVVQCSVEEKGGWPAWMNAALGLGEDLGDE